MKTCDFCEDPQQYGVSIYRDIEHREYYICVECRKHHIERISKTLNDIFKSVPGVINETRKAAEFNFNTGKTRPRFLNAEDLT